MAAATATADVDMTGGNTIEMAVAVADQDMQELKIRAQHWSSSGVHANGGFSGSGESGSGIDSELLYSQQHALSQRMEDLWQQMISQLADHKRYMQTMNTNIRHIAIKPVVRHHAIRMLGLGMLELVVVVWFHPAC